MRRLFVTMPDQSTAFAWRQTDSDNDLLRKILNNTNAVADGAHANAANGVVIGVGGFSSIVDTLGNPVVSAFGSTSAATTVTVQVSADGTTFFDTSSTQVLGAAGNFHITLSTAARYVRLKSSASATFTASILSK